MDTRAREGNGSATKVLTWCALSAIVAVLVAACSDPTAPAAPTPVTGTINETFAGTLLVSGSDPHTFTVHTVGSLSVTLASVTPPAAVGIGVGTPGAGSCSVLRSAIAVPGSAPQLTGTATVSGNLCVAVFDIGNLVEPVNYVVSVLHP